MALTYTDLIEVDLERLGTAVADWKQAVGHLRTLAKDAETGLRAKSESARWAGVNATVTRDFIRKTAKEIGDLHTEAGSIHRLLDDAHRELAELQRSVRALVSDAREQGFVVTDAHHCTVVVAEHTAPGEPPKEGGQEKAQHFADQISSKLGRANDIDQSVRLALGRTHGNDPYNAGHRTYASLDDAQAERAVELARKGDRMTEGELAELNRILRFNGRERDGEFATDFYEGLGGPEKVLEFYGLMATDGTERDAGRARLDAVGELQRNLGHALANATDPDRRHHLPPSWGAEFRKLGTQPVEWQPGMMSKPYGYQVLGGILRYGDYDPRFLTPIAEHITQLHQADPDGLLTRVGYGQGERYGFNPSGRTGSGTDPLNSVLEALGHSPEASQQFFTRPPVAYREDGAVDPGGKVDFKSYLDVFTDKHFQWNPDSNDPYVYGDLQKQEAARNFGPEALGHALESAATGRPYDDDSGHAVKHSPEAADLVRKIVSEFGAHPELIRHNENGDIEEVSGPLYAMRGSLGDITADYMGDFQRTLAGTDSATYPSSGSPARLEENTAYAFLSEVGQDPNAYASITSAQHAYTAHIVQEAVNSDSDSSVPDVERIKNATRPGGIIAGVLSESRAAAVLDYHSAVDSQFNEAAAEKQKWVNRILGIGMGKVEEVPIVGAPVGWAVEDIQESVMKSIEKDSSDQARSDAGGTYFQGRDAAIDSARTAVEVATRGKYNWETVVDLMNSGGNAADDGHSAGVAMGSATRPKR
ncbi:hypothetical protein GCM10018793_66000 [Streptomyces sulfonofaciens]|uniref:AG2 protein n=1 Tax=Streptomyces sulfonofaciens TaxID=68272 RepID=A0A919GNS4_9ACTN|nr:DUF6571 family protein [Streptomyces sulfonofaciens]GHH88013.1 hypothetical protein GCM10018793_66000 [Streptomyces sulfonofaciens]